MGTILPAEISEFLVNSLESHDDESDRTKKEVTGSAGTVCWMVEEGFNDFFFFVADSTIQAGPSYELVIDRL